MLKSIFVILLVLVGSFSFANNHKSIIIGKKLFNSRCDKDLVDLSLYKQKSQLKQDILENDICGKHIKKRRLKYILSYLWYIKTSNKSLVSQNFIKVPKDAKCPICGMFVIKYPKWVATGTHKGHQDYFDGVKDMMKMILFNHVQLSNIYVTDYYTTSKIDAKKAFYVQGSNVFGPMGNELVPFLTLDEAKKFLQDHEGKKILRFDQITEDTIRSLD
jgi:nitrous oxide reductase accessory protein NosL